MPDIIVMEFPNAVDGRGSYPMDGYPPLDFSTGTFRVMSISDDDNSFKDYQEGATNVNGGPDINQVLAEDFTYSGGTIQAGTLVSSAAETIVTGDNGSTLRVRYITTGEATETNTADPNDPEYTYTSKELHKELLNIEVVSGTFDPEGTYTVSYTNSNGGFAYANSVPCFDGVTEILTEDGPVAVAALSVGDRVVTMDNGLQAICWIGRRKVTGGMLAANPKLRPVRIRAGTLGPAVPACDLIVSRQHRILVKSAVAQRMFGSDEVLVAAIHLTGLTGVEIAGDVDELTYCHFICDGHEIILANGCPSETLYLGEQAVLASLPEHQAEIRTLFPQLALHPSEPARRFAERGKGRRMVERHARNKKQLIPDLSF